jgi:hypothetical protein
MPGTSVTYDHPNCTVRREIHVNNLTGIASTAMQRIIMHQAFKLKAVHSLVVTAGTNDVAGVDILIGTTSVGAITHGTDTAGSINTSGAINSTGTANDYIELKGKATSATMVNSYSIEYEVLPDAVFTE